MKNDALYVEISKQILRDIECGMYPESAPLPDEETLRKKYNVARSTLRRALELLKEKEVVFSVQGNGTFIKPHLFTQPLSTFYSFTDTLKNGNVHIENRILDCNLISADKALAKQTGFPEGTKFHKLLRLRSARHYPLMVETTYLPQSRFFVLDTDILSQGSLYEFLRARYGFHANHATETFQPIMPQPDERTLLHISPNTPCMLLERYSYEDDMLIEYTKSIVRGDKYVFRVEWAKDGVQPVFE